MKDFVSIKNVTFGYGSRTILEDVSLRFGSGQVVAIMGGSGMGKTTLLKLIGGLLTPQAGEICIAGCRVDTNDQKALYRLRRRMGMLFQFGALFTDLSVFDHVAFPIREQTNLDEETVRDLVSIKRSLLLQTLLLMCRGMSIIVSICDGWKVWRHGTRRFPAGTLRRSRRGTAHG